MRLSTGGRMTFGDAIRYSNHVLSGRVSDPPESSTQSGTRDVGKDGLGGKIQRTWTFRNTQSLLFHVTFLVFAFNRHRLSLECRRVRQQKVSPFRLFRKAAGMLSLFDSRDLVGHYASLPDVRVPSGGAAVKLGHCFRRIAGKTGGPIYS